jgi:serine/threonine protein kinase
MRAPMAAPDPAEELEDLLAEALAKFDEGGEDALAAFVAAHPQHAAGLERGIRRCREMGLLGKASTTVARAHPERLGDFKLVRRIGGGGMGVVYEAVQEPLGRRVALKVIRPELLYFEGARERFRREVDAIAKLDHPAIVAVHAAGEHEGVPFFTMEMLDGVTVEQLSARLRERNPAELRGEDLRSLVATGDTTTGSASGELFGGAWWEVAVRATLQVAQGLRHAHLRGIVHRDVKPSNVIVTPHGQAVVLDFGVAQVRAARELTRSGAQPGSPAFMSPEQRRGEATDERTDVFSLAATAWQFLTLQRPFRDVDAGRPQEELPPLQRHNRAAPHELDLVLRTAMDPERDRRYGDMAQFAADLQAVLDRRPIAARPLRWSLRLLRWSQRHRATAVALAVTAIAGVVMVAVLYVVQRAAQTELRHANDSLATTNSTLATTNAELERAKSALESEQQKTRASLDTALESLHAVLVRLGNDQLRAVPQADAVAHGVLLDAAALFRSLLAQHPDDAKVRWQGGRALQALAMSHERRGENEQGLAVMREALAVLGDEVPGDATLRNVRGHAWKTLASWLADTADRDGTRVAIERAERDFAAFADDPSPVLRADALRSRAALAASRSHMHDEATDPAAVERELRAAVELQRACIALGVPDDKDPGLLVMHLSNLGKLLQRQRRAAEARPVLEEALAAARALPERGTWPPPAIQVAEVQDALGSTLRDLQDPAADQLFRDSIAAREQAVAQFPSVLEFRVRLGGTMHNFAMLLWNRGEQYRDEALQLFERARALQQEALARSPRHVMAVQFMANHLHMLAYCNAILKRGERVLDAAEALAALPDRNATRALNAAGWYVSAWRLLGRDDSELLDAAMALLLDAEQRGLTLAMFPPKGFEVLQQRRQDFRDLLERLRAKAGGDAK